MEVSAGWVLAVANICRRHSGTRSGGGSKEMLGVRRDGGRMPCSEVSAVAVGGGGWRLREAWKEKRMFERLEGNRSIAGPGYSSPPGPPLARLLLLIPPPPRSLLLLHPPHLSHLTLLVPLGLVPFDCLCDLGIKSLATDPRAPPPSSSHFITSRHPTRRAITLLRRDGGRIPCSEVKCCPK